MPSGSRPGEHRGGRKKGTLNKPTAGLRAKMAELGCDPIVTMAQICVDPKNPVDLRLRAASELAQYIEPKRRAIEVDATVKVTDDRSYDQLMLDAVRIAARLGVPVPARLQSSIPREIDAEAND